MTLEEKTESLFEGLEKNVDLFILTCVDPKYPASSLKEGVDDAEIRERVAQANVSYDENHVQQAPGYSQAFYAYIDGKFERIDKSRVHENLPNGVIQVAAGKGVAVVGIPGDVLALDRDGPGFAFGNPGKAPAEAALSFLDSFIEYAKEHGKELYFVAMSHKDCGAYANNVGKLEPALKEAGLTLNKEGKDYEGSAYEQREGKDKQLAARSLVEHLNSTGINRIYVFTPKYVERTPGIVRALSGSH